MAEQCQACGSTLDPGARFCSVCGAPAHSVSEAAPSEAPAPPQAPSGYAPAGPAEFPPTGSGYLPPPGGSPGPQPAVPAAWVAAPVPGVPLAQPQGGYGPRPIEHILTYGYRLDLGRLLTEGWRLFARDPAGYIIFAFVSTLLAIVLSITLIGLIALPALFAGFWVVPLMAMKGRPTSFGDFFGGFRYFGALLLLGIVEAFLIGLGTIFFILPGIYLAIAWTWAFALVIDRGMGFWEAMSASLKVVNKNFWESLLLVLVAGLIMSAGSMVILGSLVTIPLGYCILAAGYREIFGLDPSR